MLHLQFHLMKPSQALHAFFHVPGTVRITDSRTFQKFRDLVSILRIDICNVIAYFLSVDGLINCCFFPPVNQLFRSLTGDAHNVFFPLGCK